MPAVTSPQHRVCAAQTRKHLATYEKARDLVNIGAYVHGSDQEIDAALENLPALNAFLLQNTNEFTPFEQTIDLLTQFYIEGQYAA